ncbi:MAG TPA: hypothetical protein VM557_00645 [Thermoanaerobaculia bacterium]|nr:hypothetical protein [Thermoanaerobaculia bacterium]
MTPSSSRIEFLARTIVNRLEDRSTVEFSDAERGIQIVGRVLDDHFRRLASIEAEARERTGGEPGAETELGDAAARIAIERGVVI